MEILQTYTHTVLDQCLNPNNIRATYLAYAHIAFQPFFFNAIAMHFLPDALKLRIQKTVYALCAMASIALFVRVMPIHWEMYCYQIRYYVPFLHDYLYKVPFCGEQTCSTTGAWHFEWAIKAGYNWYLDRVYFAAVFILPMLYGSWRATLYAGIMGPVLTMLVTDNANEFAAVWCLFSVAILLLMLKLPIRKYLYVHSFYGIKIPN